MIFSNTGEDFSALYAAGAWLSSNGYSYGSLCGPGMPVGFMRGDHGIAKWRNLRPRDKAVLDGWMKAKSYRDGAVELVFTKEVEL